MSMSPSRFIVALYGNTMSTNFPPEPTQEPIRGRAATPEDCTAGRAAFAASVPSPELANDPLDVFLPRVASLRSEGGDISTVVLIQAEVARIPKSLMVFGYEDSNGNLGACTSDEIQPWPCFFVFFNDPNINLDTVVRENPNGYARHGATLATKPSYDDDPILFIRHEVGPHVQHMAQKVANGSRYEAALKDCIACFLVCFADLEKALDEINTLIDIQSRLGELTGGYVYLEWNGSLAASA